ncbi:MAG: hypothetical protein R6V41_03590 [Desulfobacteraceae bacterium]
MTFLDKAWRFIDNSASEAVLVIQKVLGPLEAISPGLVIFLLAVAAVVICAFLRKVYHTRRLTELKEKFEYWYRIKNEALKQPDKAKAKRMARNIDQAQLNRVYYDYFFEGLLKSVVTIWLPFLLILAYVGNVYSPEMMAEKFGQQYLFTIGQDLKISGILWFFICVGIALASMLCIKYIRRIKSARGHHAKPHVYRS